MVPTLFKILMQSLLLSTILLLATGCVSMQATTYEAQFDPPNTYINFMGDRLPESTISKQMIKDGIKRASRLGFDVEFVAAVNSAGCDDVCFLYRPKYVDDIYVVLTSDSAQTHFRRWFHFSPLDSGSPARKESSISP